MSLESNDNEKRKVKVDFCSLLNDGRYLNASDSDFIETVSEDVQFFKKKGVQDSILIFPPFTNFHRFLIHKVVEDNFEELTTFSVGRSRGRRTVVCHKARLIQNRPPQTNSSISAAISNSMGVEQRAGECYDDTVSTSYSGRKKARTLPDVAIYRPPALRRANNIPEGHSLDRNPKPSKQRRPDLAVYVPRALRGTKGATCSSTSAPSPSQAVLKNASSPPIDAKGARVGGGTLLNSTKVAGKRNVPIAPQQWDQKPGCVGGNLNPATLPVSSSTAGHHTPPHALEPSTSLPEATPDGGVPLLPGEAPPGSSVLGSPFPSSPPTSRVHSAPSNTSPGGSKLCSLDSIHVGATSQSNKPVNGDTLFNDLSTKEIKQIVSNGEDEVKSAEIESTESESASGVARAPVEEESQKNGLVNVGVSCLARSTKEAQGSGENASANSKVHTAGDEGVVIQAVSELDTRTPKHKPVKVGVVSMDGDGMCGASWEDLFDEVSHHSGNSEGEEDEEESGEGKDRGRLLLDEVVAAVGKVSVVDRPRSNYAQFRMDSTHFLAELTHVVEIYGFPAEFKTHDLISILSPFGGGSGSQGFEIKWVDDTHALAVFASSFVAADVLNLHHPMLKARTLDEACAASKAKARRMCESLRIPYRPRPETCAALAQRLITGALGVHHRQSKAEREEERRLLREAREKRRSAARERDAAWEGTIGSSML